MKAATRVAAWHFLISLLVALVAATLVFWLWFPYPYRELAGGRELFFLVVTVDVVCGPLLTLVLFNPRKSRRELALDFGIVGLIQIAALAYGMHTLALARPVYLVYEVDRFKVVSVSDIEESALRPESGGLHRLPWTGPQVIGIREPKDPNEMLESLDLSLQGLEPSARPEWWQPYELSKAQVQLRAKPVAALRDKHPGNGALIDQAIKDSGLNEAQLLWVPLTSFKSSSWVAFVDKDSTQVLAFAALDGF